jgi:hypothetical protein
MSEEIVTNEEVVLEETTNEEVVATEETATVECPEDCACHGSCEEEQA